MYTKVTDVVWSPFVVSPVSGRDFVIVEPFEVAWTCDNAFRRRLLLPMGWRFGPGINSMPGFWRGLVNVFHLLRSSAVHDALYASQGGRRELKTDLDVPIDVSFLPLVTKREADALSREMALKDGICPYQARIINMVLRRLGKSVWED